MHRLSKLALISLALAACTSQSATTSAPVASAGVVAPRTLDKPLRVGTTRVPHGELVRAAAELKAQGIQVEVKEFDDYGRANTAVARGDLDANFFQTEPFLWRWRAAHGAPLVVVGRVHVEPMAIHSAKFKSIAELTAGLKGGEVIAVPDDQSNQGRALALLQKVGLIRLDERRGLDAGIGDIVDNPHGLKFRVEPAQRVVEQLSTVAAAVVNGNFALQGKLDPKGALFSEGGDSPFPNVVVAREDRAADPRLQALVAALRGDQSQKLMQAKYAGAVIPAQ